MAKKDFSGGLNSLLGDQPEKPKVGRPRTNFKEVTKSSEENTKEGETRATFIINKDLLEKLKGLSYWDRVTIKQVVHTALEEYLSRYEKKNGEIKTKP